MVNDDRTAGSFGPNEWLVEEMFERFQADPASVGPSWQEFFANYRQSTAPPRSAAAAVTAEASPPPAPLAAPAPAPEAEPVVSNGDERRSLKGAAARVVVNMEASLAVPTATSVRRVPAKLLEVNRKILNNHLGRRRGGKVSFTHLIGYAVVKALHDVPALNATFETGPDGKPEVVRHAHVNLGIAVDVENADGTRSLMVPAIKGADQLDFHGFWSTYEELIRKVRTKKLTADDLAGTTVTLTNPGTIGTEHSVPRLMPGQGAIIGVGALEFPAEFAAADPTVIAQLGLSKVIALTSTYDHRIIQGAE
ncbi:MAG TPA: 2-oxo acid dehydrogenase subunit E2, partial [Acidimicrobiales bacterium]|nr:2-oxo acid dehydrogenase subunit E2 [Acidimicrobiales bacterium]